MIRKTFAAVVGIVQVAIGFLSIILIYILYNDMFNVQIMFSISMGTVPLYALLLFFGLFSMISGLSFIHECQSYR